MSEGHWQESIVCTVCRADGPGVILEGTGNVHIAVGLCRTCIVEAYTQVPQNTRTRQAWLHSMQALERQRLQTVRQIQKRKETGTQSQQDMDLLDALADGVSAIHLQVKL